jgi:hypothetical protein
MEEPNGAIRTVCHCPGTPHDADLFWLAEELPMAAGLAASSATQNGVAESDALATVIPAMLRNGALARWNLVDDEGKPLALTPRSIESRLTWVKGGREFLNEALTQLIAMLNGEAAPFASPISRRMNGTSSSGGPTPKRISRTKSSSPQRRVPSESSSPAASDGAPSADPTP